MSCQVNQAISGQKSPASRIGTHYRIVSFEVKFSSFSPENASQRWLYRKASPSIEPPSSWISETPLARQSSRPTNARASFSGGSQKKTLKSLALDLKFLSQKTVTMRRRKIVQWKSQKRTPVSQRPLQSCGIVNIKGIGQSFHHRECTI